MPAPRRRSFCSNRAGSAPGWCGPSTWCKIALDLYGPPIYVRKEIVHNKHVVDELRAAGAILRGGTGEVPAGARAIFSAHGVAPSVRRQAAERRLKVIDATCPLVTKVHLEAVRFVRDGYSIVLIGHKDHDEVIGTLGEVAGTQLSWWRRWRMWTGWKLPDPTRVRYLTQTTLSLDETRDIVERLKSASRTCRGRPRRTSAMPLRTGRWRSRPYRESVRPAAGGGFAEQLQLQAPGGSGAKHGRARVPGQRLRRGGPGLARGRAQRRRHGRRFGARAPGAGTDRVPAGARISPTWRRSNWWTRTCDSRCPPN